MEEEYGVPPYQILTLRSFLGDTSDNISGVSRVPVKIITNLVRLYGSIDGVYASNLAGITKLQYTKLSEAEDQVRLNEILMRLDIGVSFATKNPNPNHIAAFEHLQGVEIQPDPILTAFNCVMDGLNVRRVHNDERICDPG